MPSTYRDILVHVDKPGEPEMVIGAAVQIGERFSSHVTGLHVDMGILQLPPTFDIPLPADVINRLEAQARDLQQSLAATFDAALTTAGLSSEWRLTSGHVVDQIAISSRYCDLLVLGQDDHSDEAWATRAIVDDVVIAAGVPTLVIPRGGAAKPLGRRIAVSWNGSRESVRAVHDALPLLLQADIVQIVRVNPTDADSEAHLPGADIALHLARLGVKTETKPLRVPNLDVCNALQSYIPDNDIDLIVMGAYGRARVRELILGGATRDMLRKMTVPVLFSH